MGYVSFRVRFLEVNINKNEKPHIQNKLFSFFFFSVLIEKVKKKSPFGKMNVFKKLPRQEICYKDKLFTVNASASILPTLHFRVIIGVLQTIDFACF